MAVATQTSTSLNARRIYPRGSHPPPRQAYESDSNSTASDTSVPLNKQRERRQGRAEDYNNIPGEHRTSGGGDMSSHTVQGRYSDSKPYKKDPVVTVQEVREGRVRRIHGSEHRHRHHRSDRERDAGCERIRVYRDPRRSGEESDRARPNVIRRSTVREGATSRTTNERPRRGERRESHRRDLERRSSRYKPIGSPPLRREKRSVSDEVPRSTRDRVPVR